MEATLKKEISKHVFAEAEHVIVSKFFHAQATSNSKVLFYCTKNGEPLCVLKLVRSVSANEKLENEMRGQMQVGKMQNTFKTAHVQFFGHVEDHFFYAEDVIDGVPIGKRHAQKYMKRIYEYQCSMARAGFVPERRIERIIENSKGLQSTPQDAIIYFESHTPHLYSSCSHGDLTYMNVLTGNGPLHIIDWERYNERPIWGVDFVHYAIRAYGIRSLAEMSSFLYGTEYIDDENRVYLLGAYAADILLDSLQKGDEKSYRAVVQEMRHET